LFSGQGIDVTSTVNQLVTAARAPETAWQQQQQKLQSQGSALTKLNNDLSALQDATNSLKDVTGALGTVTTNSSNSSVVTAAAQPGTAAGTHVLVVNNLATTSSYYSDPAASGSTPLADGGSFTLQVGSGAATTISIDSSDDTLQTLASKINGMDLGVSANVITDANGARLSLVAQSSGAASDITISADSSGLNFTKAVTGTNASLTVDGVPVSSASNSVSGVVTGVTFNLVGSAPGTEVTVGVASDATSAIQAVNDFVNAYNSAIQDLNAQFAYSAGSNTAGPLSGDTTTRMVQQQLLSFANYQVTGGSFATLGSLGISMGNDGTLSVDATALNNAINTDYSGIQDFFQSSSGFATYVSGQLSQLTDPTEGAFYVEFKSDQTTYNDLQDSIDNLETYIASKQTAWLAQYNQINVTLQELPLLQQQINAELGFITNNSSNSK
jgi:flagellar hook-associated protein 2